MNKAELIEAISKRTGVTKKDTERVMEGFITEVTETLKKGDRIKIVGFGSFESATRAARTGRNPATGETMTIKGRKAPKFIAGKALKDALN